MALLIPDAKLKSESLKYSKTSSEFSPTDCKNLSETFKKFSSFSKSSKVFLVSIPKDYMKMDY